MAQRLGAFGALLMARRTQAPKSRNRAARWWQSHIQRRDRFALARLLPWMAWVISWSMPSGALFNEVSAALLSHFRFDNCDRLRWEGVGHFEAPEDQAYFVANTPLECLSIYLRVCHLSRSGDPEGFGKNKRRLLHVDGRTAPSSFRNIAGRGMDASSRLVLKPKQTTPRRHDQGWRRRSGVRGLCSKPRVRALLQKTLRQAAGYSAARSGDNGVYGSSAKMCRFQAAP